MNDVSPPPNDSPDSTSEGNPFLISSHFAVHPLGHRSIKLEFGELIGAIFKLADHSPAEHRVPVRFGMSGMVGLLTLMSVLFACMRSLESPVAMYVYVSVQTLAICLLQMRFNDAVRGASMLVGAIWLPLFLIAETLFEEELAFRDDAIVMQLIGLPCTLAGGAFCGYLNGAIAAGLFMILSGFESKPESPIMAELVESNHLQGEKNEP